MRKKLIYGYILHDLDYGCDRDRHCDCDCDDANIDGGLLTACCTPDAGSSFSYVGAGNTSGYLANWKVVGDPG